MKSAVDFIVGLPSEIISGSAKWMELDQEGTAVRYQGAAAQAKFYKKVLQASRESTISIAGHGIATLSEAQKRHQLEQLLINHFMAMSPQDQFEIAGEGFGDAALLVPAGIGVVGTAGKAVKGVSSLGKIAESAEIAETVPAMESEAHGATQELDRNYVIGDRLRQHVLDGDGMSGKRGVSGAHRLSSFLGYEKYFKIISAEEHPFIPGIYKINYRMRVLDRALNPTDEFKSGFLRKTVFDSRYISDEDFLQYSFEAFYDARSNTLEEVLVGRWKGYSSNGLMFGGFTDSAGEITTVFPIIGEE